LDDVDLMTHLLHLCVQQQTKYNLTENTTPVVTRALLLVLENIKNNAKLNAKPPSMIKTKGADGKCKIESIDARILKNAFSRNPRRRSGLRNTACYARSMVGRTKDATHMAAILF
jgi:hypothetical protein